MFSAVATGMRLDRLVPDSPLPKPLGADSFHLVGTCSGGMTKGPFPKPCPHGEGRVCPKKFHGEQGKHGVASKGGVERSHTKCVCLMIR
jgi:hypothetical protein